MQDYPIKSESVKETGDVRVYYKDGTYIDTDKKHAWEYENDPNYEKTLYGYKAVFVL